MTEHGKGEEPVIMPQGARTMHLAVMGLSGVGKTYFLENLIRQDIEQGTGLAVFDVHGDLADSIIAYLAEHARNKPEALTRIVLIEPFDPHYSIGFNPLERTLETSEYIQAQEMAKILHARWETKTFGPRTEELLRNALYTLSAHQLTLLELPALLVNRPFRDELVEGLREPAVIDYWKGRYDPLSEPMKAAVREPLLTRISGFLADPHIRQIVGQPRSTFTFEQAIGESLWIIINLSKGKLGENSVILGSLLFTKLELAVMAQARTPEAQRKLFTVYADELQNFTGGNFATLVAEARKYRVSLTASHQYWSQLPQALRSAMLSVGSRVLFRLHYHDALQLAGEIEPKEKQWAAALLTTLPRGTAVFRTGAQDPLQFRVERHIEPQSTREDIDQLRRASHARYSTARSAIAEDIDQRYRSHSNVSLAKLLQKLYSASTNRLRPPFSPTYEDRQAH